MDCEILSSVESTAIPTQSSSLIAFSTSTSPTNLFIPAFLHSSTAFGICLSSVISLKQNRQSHKLLKASNPYITFLKPITPTGSLVSAILLYASMQSAVNTFISTTGTETLDFIRLYVPPRLIMIFPPSAINFSAILKPSSSTPSLTSTFLIFSFLTVRHEFS